jgi:alpha-1,6-mannosyltransferase
MMIQTAPPAVQEGTSLPSNEALRLAALARAWWARLLDFAGRYLAGVRGLAIAGSATLAIYVLLTLAFPVTAWWYRTDDNLGTIPLRAQWARPLLGLGGPYLLSTWMGILTTVVVVALFGLQGMALFAAHHASDVRRARRVVIAFTIAFVIVAFWMQPVTSTDLYGYIARAYLMATLHLNPTISQSALLPGGYLVPHARPPAPYGPLWLLACWLVGLLSGENLLAAMLIFKTIMAAATLATVGLVAWLIDRLLPGQRVTALVLFAWSPLLILEAVGNAHNDIVMMLCVVASLAAVVARRPLWALPALALGVFIKYSVGALVPLWVAYLVLQFCWRAEGAEQIKTVPTSWSDLRAWLRQVDWRRALAIIGGGGAISVALAVICYGPFWVGLKTFTGLGQQLGATYFNGSIAELLYAALEWTAPAAHAASVGSAIRYSLYAVFVVYVIWQTMHVLERGRTSPATLLAQMSGKVVFATLVLVTFWYQPWYIVWLLPLAALAPDGILRRHALALAFGGALTYVVEYFAFVNQSALERSFFVQFFLVIVAFAPLLVLRHGNLDGLVTALRERFSIFRARIALHPDLVNRIMLGLILLIAALLRLVRLGAPAASDTSGNALRAVSSSLSTSLADTQGLSGPFHVVDRLTQAVFGQTPFAVLLPSAILGTITVWLIYLLALELFPHLEVERRQWLALVAALLAATAQWHVALSRSGAQVVVLPLLLCTAVLAFWRAQRAFSLPAESGDSTRIRYLALAGVAVGLMSDAEPSLWALPVFVLLAMGIIGWRRGWWQRMRRADITALAISIFISILPTIWASLSPSIGFAPGSLFLARGGTGTQIGFAPLQASYWGNLFSTIGAVVHTILTQDYEVAGPTAGGVPIVPTLFLPFVILGLFLIVRRGRQPGNSLVLWLAVLPLAITLLTGAAPGIIEAATLLPVACIAPALGLTTAAYWIASLPGILAGADEDTVFVSRRNLLQLGLLLMVVIMTISTFFWYFAATLPGPTNIVQPL